MLAAGDPTRVDEMRAVAERWGCAYMVGLHPWWADVPEADALLVRLETMPLPHGLGECGLDHVRARDPGGRARQLTALRVQLAIAARRNLPPHV